MNEFRRSPRRKATNIIMVTDAMTGRAVGHVSNLSETGMLLIASAPLGEDALYQFEFPLPSGDGPGTVIELGAHLLWLDQASAPGQAWAGFRFIGVSEQQLARLRGWIDSPGAQYA